MPWQDSRIQEAAAELPVGFPAPLGGHRAPKGQHELPPGGEGAPTPNVSAAAAVLPGISPTHRLCARLIRQPLRQVKSLVLPIRTRNVHLRLQAIAQGLQAARSEWMASQGAAVEEPAQGELLSAATCDDPEGLACRGVQQ